VPVDGVDFVYRQLGPACGVPIVFLNHLTAVLDNTIEAMAHDTVAFIQALGLDQVDLLGFSVGGFIAQVIAREQPQLVRKIILAGTGSAGGEGIDKVTTLTLQDIARVDLTFKIRSSSSSSPGQPTGVRLDASFCSD
jgi:pimeloyl-ACP methyl ester carboxylesterase